MTAWPAAVEPPAQIAVAPLIGIVQAPGTDQPLDLPSFVRHEAYGEGEDLRNVYVPAGQQSDPDELVLEVDSHEPASYTDSATLLFTPSPVEVEAPPELFLELVDLPDRPSDAAVMDFLMRYGPLWVREDGRDDLYTVAPVGWDAASDPWDLWDVATEEEADALIAEGLSALEIASRLHERRAGDRSHQLRQASALLGSPQVQPSANSYSLYRYLVRPSGDVSPVDHEGYGPRMLLHDLDVQRHAIRYYAAVFETLASWTPSDLESAALADMPRDDLHAIWRRRGFEPATTGFELAHAVMEEINTNTVPGAPRLQLDAGEVIYGRPLLSALPVMALQAVTWAATGVPVKRCASETCGRLFSVQTGRAEKGQRRTRGVLYCSARCAQNQASREWRRRQRDAT
ncbi:hypothetical protein DVS28_a1081 [Euzebya pacifica]|uniref:CGNR zinc finger domain-containing protein n=2 Tax=Euzebya pacifica TaxID=1608957 RepID=A0A346XU85_9ACTN|nr:hypothetical protein DVS28_a1081 [Euzebya pacifica]